MTVAAASPSERRSGVSSHAPRSVVTVSGVVPPDIEQQIEQGVRPCPDYVALAGAMDADLLDLAAARLRAGRFAAVLERVGGAGLLLAWVCFRDRRRYEAVLTDGEQVGLPLALLLAATPRRRRGAHVMIAHILSVRKKALLFRLLRLGRRIDRILVYSTWQQRFVRQHLRYPHDRVVFTPFLVDTRFFAVDQVVPKPDRLICAAGLERRDYLTLIGAVRDLDVRVVIAAASPWSTRRDSSEGADLPSNVVVCSLDFVQLRQLYADSLFVVMPLEDVEFQAGVTTILEAMAMEKAVVCSRTRGQTDVIVEGETGLYVRPGDVEALRATIIQLLDDPAAARRMGQAGRAHVITNCAVPGYAQRLAELVAEAQGPDR